MSTVPCSGAAELAGSLDEVVEVEREADGGGGRGGRGGEGERKGTDVDERNGLSGGAPKASGVRGLGRASRLDGLEGDRRATSAP